MTLGRIDPVASEALETHSRLWSAAPSLTHLYRGGVGARDDDALVGDGQVEVVEFLVRVEAPDVNLDLRLLLLWSCCSRYSKSSLEGEQMTKKPKPSKGSDWPGPRTVYRKVRRKVRRLKKAAKRTLVRKKRKSLSVP